jgi:hypothetical protein
MDLIVPLAGGSCKDFFGLSKINVSVLPFGDVYICKWQRSMTTSC